MKANGFVGKIILVVVGLLSNPVLRAETPGEPADGRLSAHRSEPGDGVSPTSYEPGDQAGTGVVRIRDEPEQAVSSEASEGHSGTDEEWIVDSVEGADAVFMDETAPGGTGSFLGFGRPRTGRRGWFVGGSFLNLDADFDSNTAFFINDQTGSVNTTVSQNFNFDEEASPRVWAGWQDDWGLGVRVTWFDFGDEERTSRTAPADFIFFNGLRTPTATGRLLVGGSAGDFIVAKTSVDVYTIDAELTQELNFDNWQTTVGGGFRHGSLSQQYRAVGTASGVKAISDVGHRFDGQGPTVFGEVRVPVVGTGDRRERGTVSFALFGHARGSVLFGDAKLSATDINPSSPTSSVATASLRDRDNLTIGEVRIGGQIDMRTKGGNLVFLKAGWESQWLTGAGSLSNLNTDNDLVLSGFSFSAGADW